MKILYYGGQKSGKSYLAEKRTLLLSKETKPYYIATYDNSYNDIEMAQRIQRHKSQREDKFITIEESSHISKQIKKGQSYLIDCMSMWLLNMLNEDEKILLNEIDNLAKSNANIVFVLNDVNSGVIPLEAISRRYVDLSGVIGQKLAQICDEVYEVKLGLCRRLK